LAKKAAMDKDYVLSMFAEEADKLGETHIRLSDTLQLLAELLADSGEQLSNESFDTLVHIGASISKTCATRAKARSEIAITMKESVDASSAKI